MLPLALQRALSPLLLLLMALPKAMLIVKPALPSFYTNGPIKRQIDPSFSIVMSPRLLSESTCEMQLSSRTNYIVVATSASTRKGESLSSYLSNIQADITHLTAQVRRTTITTLADIIKLKNIFIHAIWTKDIVPGTTTERQIQEINYNFGVHLEYKVAETESCHPSVAAFPVVDPQTEVIRLRTD